MWIRVPGSKRCVVETSMAMYTSSLTFGSRGPLVHGTLENSR